MGITGLWRNFGFDCCSCGFSDGHVAEGESGGGRGRGLAAERVRNRVATENMRMLFFAGNYLRCCAFVRTRCASSARNYPFAKTKPQYGTVDNKNVGRKNSELALAVLVHLHLSVVLD